ncbi:MAG: AtpZ/AtpI family protein [Candidatus Coatesbacteria bacterium]|nr:AtpZ/AtpI family protein [Candidatus Coatesbacteria bacterium]
MKKPQDEAVREFFRSFGLITQIGLTVVLAIGIGFAGGFYIDRWLDTGHVFLIIGILLGIGAAFFNVYRMLLRGFVPPSADSSDDIDNE